MEEHKENDIKQAAPDKKAPATGEQYLRALFVVAEWIPEEYRGLASGLTQEVLRELYLCACENVPAKKAKEALEKKNREKALHHLRLKKIEEEALSESTLNLNDLMKRTEGFEKEIHDMAQTISQIAAAQGPTIQEVFPERKAETQQPKAESKEKPEISLPEKASEKQSFILSVRRKGQKHFVEKMFTKGYSNEQISFILDCIEEGLSEKQIKSFASPKLPVPIMLRLKNLKIKEGKHNG